MLELIDEIRTLQWQFAGSNPEKFPTSKIEQIRQVFAQRELAKEAEKQPPGITDIRSKKPIAPQAKASPKPSNIRERIARAQAANQ